MRVRKYRDLWLRLHAWLGLAFGLWFAMMAVTGCYLVFYVEIDHWRNFEQPIAVSPAPKTVPLDTIAQTLQAFGVEGRAWRVEMPMYQGWPITARLYKPTYTAHRSFAPLVVSLDNTGERVTSSYYWGESFSTFVYDLHYLLLLDESGPVLVAVAGLLLCLSLLTGLYLWWPKHGKWRTALRVKLAASSSRMIYDLHKTSALLTFVVVMMLGFTGAALSRPEWFSPLVVAVSTLSSRPALHSTIVPGGVRHSVDGAVSKALESFPGAELRWIEMPIGDRGTYLIRLYQRGEPGRRFPKTMVWLDQYSLTILAVENPMQRSAGDAFYAWLHPLHSGEAFGLLGRWAVFVSGVGVFVLVLTGWLRWLGKRHSRNRTSGS